MSVPVSLCLALRSGKMFLSRTSPAYRAKNERGLSVFLKDRSARVFYLRILLLTQLVSVEKGKGNESIY